MKRSLLLVLALAPVSNAQTWTGAVDGNWNSAGNWSGGVPVGGVTTAVVFDQAAQPTTVNDIPGGLTLNSLTFGVNSGVRTTTGNAFIFDGVAPTLRMRNGVGTGNSLIANSVVLNQTLALEGGPDFPTQLIMNPASVISGSGGIRVVGGLVSFNGTNTYQGPTVIEAGGLGVNRSTSFGSSPSVTVQPGSWLQLIGTSGFTINKPLTLGGQGTTVPATRYAFAASGAGTKSWEGPITLSDDATFNAFGTATLSLSGTSGMDLSGHDLTLRTGTDPANGISISKAIGGAGNITVLVNPVGNGVSFSGSNTFSGSVLIATGRLSIHSDAAFGQPANPVTIDGGTLRAANGLTIPATRPITIGSSGANFRGGDGPQAGQALVLETPLAGPNPIGISQRVTLDAANGFSGPVTVQPGGVLKALTDSSLGAPTSDILLNGDAAAAATLVLPPDFNAVRSISVSGTQGTIETTAPVTFTNAFTGPGELGFSSFDGAVTLTTANTHQGGTRLVSGMVKIHDDSALGPVDTPLFIGSQGVLAASADITIPASRPITLGGGDFDTSGVEIHVLGNMEAVGNNSASITGTGVFRFDGTMTGAGSYVEKATLSGTGSYSGFMNVSEEATIAPGGAITMGALRVGGIRMHDGTLRVRVGSGSSDRIIVTSGQLDMSSKLVIIPSGPIAANEVFVIAEKHGTDPDNTSFYSPANDYLGNNQTFTQGGVIWSIDYQGGDGNEITLTALNGNASPLSPPKIGNFTVAPGSSLDPENPASYPRVSGAILSGVPGSTVFLECSTDLGQMVEWTVMETFTLDAAGGAVFTDLISFDSGAILRNFFRLRVP